MDSIRVLFRVSLPDGFIIGNILIEAGHKFPCAHGNIRRTLDNTGHAIESDVLTSGPLTVADAWFKVG